MAAPNEKLAESLDVLKALQEGGRRVFMSDDFSRVHRERLVENGFLQDVMKGWLISSSPGARQGAAGMARHGSGGAGCGLRPERVRRRPAGTPVPHRLLRVRVHGVGPVGHRKPDDRRLAGEGSGEHQARWHQGAVARGRLGALRCGLCGGSSAGCPDAAGHRSVQWTMCKSSLIRLQRVQRHRG